MPAQTIIPPLPAEQHQALVDRFNDTDDPETRLRYQMVLLANDYQWSPREIAPLVQRSHDAVLRVLQRYQTGGLAAVPRPRPRGRTPTITAAWLAELQRVVERPPREVDVPSANWTTATLAAYLERVTGISTAPETVRRYLHRLGYVCKRPNWTVQHKAVERPDYAGNGSGWSSC